MGSYSRIIAKLNEMRIAAEKALAAKLAAAGHYTGGFVKKGFATGGFTYGGTKQIAGVVHGGEWVAPNWMVKNFRPLFATLENMRRVRVKGFEEGGEVSTQTITNVPITMNNNVYSEVDYDLVAQNLAWTLKTI